MIDLLLYLNWIPLFTGLWSGLAALLAGMELLALGTWLYMKSALGSGPRDALMVVLARKTNLNFFLLRFTPALLHQENLPETIRRLRSRRDPGADPPA